MFVVMESENLEHILRVLNANIKGRQKVMYALTSIKGVGHRFSKFSIEDGKCRPIKRAGSLTNYEIDRIVTIITNP